jgi:uncharacterized DUF497 family protein
MDFMARYERFELNGRLFEWDPEKAESNIRDHEGVTFHEAATVFEDQLAITKLERIVSGEERWQLIGRSKQYLLLLVVHTYRENADDREVVRIISARQLKASERRKYGKGI